jgi:hypothetical protein
MQLKPMFSAAAREAELADAQQSVHVAWREASAAVGDTYRRWSAAPRGERWLAHAAYLAALEREEHAARDYQDLVEQIRAR